MITLEGFPVDSPSHQSPPARPPEPQRSQLPAGNEHYLENTTTTTTTGVNQQALQCKQTLKIHCKLHKCSAITFLQNMCLTRRKCDLTEGQQNQDKLSSEL